MRPLPMQRVLFPIAAFAAVAIYLIWWVTYAGIHYNARYSIRPPGAAAEVEGSSVRLLSLVRSDRLADASGGSQCSLTRARYGLSANSNRCDTIQPRGSYAVPGCSVRSGGSGFRSRFQKSNA